VYKAGKLMQFSTTFRTAIWLNWVKFYLKKYSYLPLDGIKFIKNMVTRLPECSLTEFFALDWPPVLRIRIWIRDPVPFWLLDLGSRGDIFLGIKFYNSLKLGPDFFSSAFKKWNNFQFCEICGYKKRYYKNFCFTPLFCCCFWIRDPRSEIRDE